MLSVVYHRVQNQVTEVIDVMKDNIGKVLDRGEKLSELESKSGKLIIWITIQHAIARCFSLLCLQLVHMMVIFIF